MIVRTAAILALVGLAACTAGTRAPQPVGADASAAPEDRLVAGIEAEGCVLTSANVGAVLLRANLTQAELPALTSALAGQGRLEAADGGSIRVLSANCI